MDPILEGPDLRRELPLGPLRDAFVEFHRLRLQHPIPWRAQPSLTGGWEVIDAVGSPLVIATRSVALCVAALPDLLADELSPLRSEYKMPR